MIIRLGQGGKDRLLKGLQIVEQKEGVSMVCHVEGNDFDCIKLTIDHETLSRLVNVALTGQADPPILTGEKISN